MWYKFFFSIYYGKYDYASMKLEDQEDHIKYELEVRRKSLNNDKVEAMINQKHSLIDHYFMIINLKENLQGYGLSNQF
jgi:hypothetical protein